MSRAVLAAHRPVESDAAQLQRADCCGGAPHVRVTLAAGGALRLCVRHEREHGPALLAEGASVTPVVGRVVP